MVPGGVGEAAIEAVLLLTWDFIGQNTRDSIGQNNETFFWHIFVAEANQRLPIRTQKGS